jgi:hypothetical protein
MALHRFSKLEVLEDRHPGLCRQVEAMLKARVPVRVIAAVIQAQYGEYVGPLPLRMYRMECWDIWRKRARKESGDREIGRSGDRANSESGHLAIGSSGHLKAREAAAGALAFQ